MSRFNDLQRCAALTLAGAFSLAGCTAVETFAGGDRVDYRSATAKPASLDVPPDLTQLTRDTRYQTQAGAVSAAAFQAGTTVQRSLGSAPLVAPQMLGKIRLERDGNQRWLSTPLSPEQLWPQLQAFWKENNLPLALDQPIVGVMETEWTENYAKLTQDIVRRTIGRIFPALFSTGERDKYTTRVERSASGSDVFIAHRGLLEVMPDRLADSTVWQRRPNDPDLEATFLARLMVKLGLPDEQAKSAVVAPASTVPARARVLEGRPAATLQVDDNFERAWRRVGLALDRSGFTVEDRDRTQGVYFVRYIDPAFAGQEEPGFFAKLFGADKGESGPKKFRIQVKGEGAVSLVSVLNAQGLADTGENGKRITSLLVEDLK